MKWVFVFLIGSSLFIGGALYGIEQDSSKVEQVITNVPSGDSNKCVTFEETGEVPWITRLALFIGGAVAMCFNGIALIIAGVVHIVTG
ncbi:hypothetical protein EQV77_01615 [Halobacillus fulvus]|nr:hypothetical protein EQV77_01615 [Halobacillus fulvus]